MKKSVFCIITLLVMLANSIGCKAKLPTPTGKYISDVCVMATDTWAFTYGMTIPQDYLDNVLNEGGWSGAFSTTSDKAYADVNGGKGDYRVFILYKTTDNPREAITNLMVVYNKPGDYSYSGDANGNTGHPFEYDGRMYYPAKFSTSAEDSKVTSGSVDSGGGNLNRGTGKNKDNLYLYYTKDGNISSNGSIISGAYILTTLEVEYQRNQYHHNEYVPMYNPYTREVTSSADCNQSAGGAWIYLKMPDRHCHKGGADFEKCKCGETAIVENVPELDSRTNSYMIYNLSQLCWWRDAVNANTEKSLKMNAKLCGDIDMANILNIGDGKWTPVCPVNNEGHVWTGTFDGNGHKLTNFIQKDNTSNNPVGLFGTAGGTICNLTMENADIVCGHYGGAAIASLAKGELTIKNCKVTGSISGQKGYIAGFANVGDEMSKVTISSCVNEATVTDGSGFVGAYYNTSSTQNVDIENCINKGAADCAFATKPVGKIMNCMNTAEGTALIHTYTDRRNLTMKYVLNAGNDVFDRGVDYIPNNADYCYARYITDEASYEDYHLYSYEITNGKACYLMNGETSSKDAVWRQTIGTNTYPTPIHEDDDITRVVYSFKTSCSSQNFTNSRYYAEDMDNGGHMFSFTKGEVTNGKLKVKLTCSVCGNSYDREAEKDSERIVKNRTCEHDGWKLVCYKLTNPDKTFYVKETIKTNLSASLHMRQGNINYYAIDGVPNNLRECKYCKEMDWQWSHTKYTEENGWEIMDFYDMMEYLEHIRTYNQGNTVRATLFADIDMTEVENFFCPWLYNGTRHQLNKIIFNGNGHTISGLALSNSNYTGLFTSLKDSEVSNLTLEGIVIEGNGSLLCSKAENCLFTNITTRGVVAGTNGAAGLCYDTKDCTFNNCHNYAEISADGPYLGGIVSAADGGNILRCTNRATIDGRNSKCVGGLVGDYKGLFTIHNSGNYGTIYGKENVGGIVGAFAQPGAEDRDELGGLGELDEFDNATQSYLYNTLNTGNVILTSANYTKGGLAGLCGKESEKDDTQILVQRSYYKGAQVNVGFINSKPIAISGDGKCTEEQLTSGDVCNWLNRDNGELVWQQSQGEHSYPYPTGSADYKENLYVNNCNLYVPENSVITDLYIHPDNSGKDYYFKAEVPFTVNNIKYRRDAFVTKQKYATLYLPFAFSDERLKVMEFNYYDDATGKVYFSEVEGMTEPNHPYLVRQADENDEKEVMLIISAENANIVPVTEEYKDFAELPYLETGFYGTYVQSTLLGTLNYYAFSAKYGDFRKANASGTDIYPFRATFKVGHGSAAPARLILPDFEDGVTQIEVNTSDIVEMDNTKSVYNLNGQRVANSLHGLKSGIYILNGKKVNVK